MEANEVFTLSDALRLVFGPVVQAVFGNSCRACLPCPGLVCVRSVEEFRPACG